MKITNFKKIVAIIVIANFGTVTTVSADQCKSHCEDALVECAEMCAEYGSTTLEPIGTGACGLGCLIGYAACLIFL